MESQEKIEIFLVEKKLKHRKNASICECEIIEGNPHYQQNHAR